MSIKGTSNNNKNFNISDFQEISKTDIQKSTKQTLENNIKEKLNEKGFFAFVKKLFNPKRTIALNNLSKHLEGSTSPEASWFCKHLPQSTQKLFNNYLSLFSEEFKESLSQEEFQRLWENKQEKAIGKGGFGRVYQSKCGKYALKVANQGESLSTDIKGNEALKNNAKAFDISQLYYKENAGFITKYIGTFKTKEKTEVNVFEKIEGKDFNKCTATNITQQCRLLAQAATAIAISHEAGCINSDIKPANMMITNKLSLKLIDQGAIIDLTKKETEAKSCTLPYAAPEILEGSNISPAADVFSLGVTILEKLSDLYQNNKTGIKDLAMRVKKGFNQEAEGNKDDFSRENVSKNIANLCETRNILGTKEESKFIGLLLKDCLAYKPENRISAAQAGEILQVFSSYLEAKKSGSKATCPNYNEIKAMALQDCPKGIPIALRKMLFDPNTQSKGISIIENLVKADPSYAKTPSYGFILLLNESSLLNKIFGRGTFQSWAKQNQEAVQWLKERTYIQGNTPQANQDMPVSKAIYTKIQKLK